MILNAFQFACTLSTMNPLKFGLGDVFDHCFIELRPHDLLHFNVFKLYVANAMVMIL
jgi:hypothetical protein